LLADILLKLGFLSLPTSISGAEAALGLLIIMVFIKVFRTKDYSILKKGFFIFYISMIAMVVISAFTGIDTKESLRRLSSPWVLMYLPVLYVIFEGKDKITYLMFMFTGGMLSTFYGFYRYLFDHQLRMKGFLTHALTYGNVTALVCITALGVLLFKVYEKRSHQYITFAALIICTVGLIMSGSRGPILSFGICALAMVIYRFRWRGVIAGLLLFALFSGVVYSVPSVHKRFVGTFANIDKPKSSIGTRLILWDATSQAIMVRPFFGYGSGNFRKVISEYVKVPVSSRAHAHNTYLQYTFLHGFFGLAALLGFLGSLMWEILRRRRSSGLIKVSIFVLLLFMLEGLTENALGDSEVVMACLAVIGLALAPGRPAITAKKTSTEAE
jgi:O-antigen ligase